MTGGKCGSTYIDRSFHDLLSKRFGQSFDSLPAKEKGPASQFMRCFEKNKRAFESPQRFRKREISPLKMDVEDSKFYDEEENAVILTGHVLPIF